MALLMLLVISHCIPPTAVAEKCEKPVIRVITEGSTRTGSKVMIECSSSSNYTIKGCTFYKNELTLHTNTFSTQYVIENATASDEGFYTCECYTDKNHTETSFRVPLILNNQVEEPDIRIEENGNKIVCSSRTSSYKYRLCILYQNEQQIEDTSTKYNNNPTGKVSFTVPQLPGETRFKCLCYTDTSRWTRNSSAITKGGKLYSGTATTTKSKPKPPTTAKVITTAKKETTATTMSPTTATTTTKTMPPPQPTTTKGITTAEKETTTTNCDYTVTNIIKLCHCLMLPLVIAIFTLMKMHRERNESR